MPIDAPTTMFLTLAISAIAAGYLALEWRALRDPALLRWSGGFATVALGCALVGLRAEGSFLIGIWVANGLLVTAHLFFLHGAGRFAGQPIARGWMLALPIWAALLLLPADPTRALVFGVVNAGLVAVLALATAATLLRASIRRGDDAAARVGIVFLLHGAWYCVKMPLVLVQGGQVDLMRLKGFSIQLSLFEGVVVEMLLALLMAASIRRRREQAMLLLAEQDPLTGLLNRRAFTERASRALRDAAQRGRPCALMLIDFDGFKQINDGFGHGFGDRVLVAFARAAVPLLPHDALFARLGGDEFALLLPDADEAYARAVGAALCVRFAGVGAGFEGCDIAATVSIGAALFARHVELASLLDVADAALYEAKRSGRNQLCARSVGPVLACRRPEERPARAAPLFAAQVQA